MKKIAITGGNGFIGSRLLKKLSGSEWQATALVRKGSDISLLSKDTDVLYVDYNNAEELHKQLIGYDILIHNAAVTKANNPQIFQQINVGLTAKMVELVNEVDSIEQLIFISSQAAVGPTTDKVSLTEDAVCKPVSMYGESKLKAEELIRKKCKKNFTILRPVSVYGPGEKDFLQYFQIIKHHLAVKIGREVNRFNLIYVDDLLDVIITCFLNRNAFNETFFVSNNEPITLPEFTEGIQEALHTFTLPIYIPQWLLSPAAVIAEIWGKIAHNHPTFNREKAREMSYKNWSVNNNKMRNKLDIVPKTTLWEGLFATTKWYKDKGWL